ncbi:MAG TPA: acyl carrier protein [Gemmatimonadales bacterium]
MNEQRAASAERQIIDRVRAYVRENYLYMRPDWPLPDDAPLLGSGVVDSIGVVELVEFLEREFAVTIPEDEITERHLGSLAAIAAFVVAKRNAEPARSTHAA